MSIKEKNDKLGINKYVDQPHYSYFKSLLSIFKKIGVDKDTKIIMALEGHSWRKDYAGYYKANRPDYTEWKPFFDKINNVNDKLNKATKFHFIRDWNAECDDIIAVACKYFKDDEVIIVSSDGDLKQLCNYPNTKFFTVHIKCRGSNGCYIPVSNPLKVLADKVRKGDKSDNIIPQKDETEEDAELREFLVNLLELPEFVEQPIIEKLDKLKPKQENLNLLPFKNSKEKFLQIYKKDKILDYDYCVQLQDKRKVKKAKKAKLKRQKKKESKS
jgi:hypothetical protein